MRILRRALGLGALLAAGLILTNGALRASDAPVVHVKAVVNDGAVRLQADANAPFEYSTYRPSASLYVLDLTGVSAADPAGARVVASDLVKSYRLITYSSGAKPVVRLEILLAEGVEPKLERQGSEDLTLLVSRAGIVPSADSSVPATTNATLVPVSAKASASTPSAHQAIRQVHLEQNGASTEVSISGSGPLTYHSIQLQNPDRLVLDFAGSHLTTSEKQIASNLDPVREIRLAQFTPEISRVVIDLREPARYNIKGDGSTVTVSFEAKGAAAAAAQPADSASTVTTKSEAVRASTAPGEIPAPAAALPASMTQTSAALATPVAAPVKEAIETASNTAPAPAPAPAPVAAAAPAPEAAPAPIAQTPGATTVAPVGKYSGEPISVNLKDVDLRDFFRLIHEISGLNVVVDPGVKGNLTIVLDDVPWDQALDIVLKNNDLDKQLDGNVLRLATKDTLRKEADENRDLAKAVAESAEVVTTTRVLSYAKATALAVTLKKFLSSRGDIIADDRSNTLIIRDIPTTLPVMDNLIRQLDRKSQQVEIEARVVEANRSFSREIGTQFGFAGANPSRSNVVGGTGGVGTSPITRGPGLPTPPVVVSSSGASSGNTMPLASNLPASVPTSGIQYAFSSANFALDMIITAAEQRGVGKLLSKPKVITQNNEKATVKQGTKIPVQTIVNNTVSVQFVDAVLELDVTPQITADGTVYMDVTVENDQIDGSIPRVQGIPAIDTQAAETKVTVNDGATVVIGGIIVTQQTTNIQQVPFVGSVPILGNLFKHTTVNSTSQELLFFLTPRILPS
ncbi:MAG TPA: type IV pilus secretin PilQ [Candidatus Cybelea sp.]|jgi:type IV pilus secretin PilQ/predicted competence protein|nr:type IV pilus secretin PilQ [Candidatus Cybelea sp.]